jgi:hypothetical protein
MDAPSESGRAPGREPGHAPSRATAVVAGGLSVLLALVAVRVALYSLDWRMELDTPLLSYMAFMVDEQDAAPYRDIFVTSFPGAILFHLLILETFGHGDGPFMAFNLLWLALISGVTFGILRSFGWRTALGGCALTALAYLKGGVTKGGAELMLQRDFVLVLPVAIAVLIHVSRRGSDTLRAAWIGAMFALAVSIKPHAGIALPLLLLCERVRARERSPGGSAPGLLRPLAGAAVGFALPTAAIFGWVVASGGWPTFMEMVREYLPLHVSLSRTHRTLEGAEFWVHLVANTREFGRSPGWLVAASVGPLAVLASGRLTSEQRRLVLLLVGLAVLFCGYVILAGQFWNYHWLPFRHFTALLSALCLAGLARDRADRWIAWHPIGSLLLTLFIVLPIPLEAVGQWAGMKLPPPDEGRVDAISEYLVEHLEPGDTVQPFDWARGGIHAMLQARAPIATPFVSDYHFYHHVDSPYVRELRRRFLADLEAAPPRFIVDIVDRPMPAGPGTSRDFPELRAFVEQRYARALEGPGWVVYERR